MRGDNVLNVTRYLFKDDVEPKVKLGHEGCLKIITSVKDGKRKYLKVRGIDKEVYLKKLDRTFFVEGDTSFTRENTIVVDNSPYKHILNNPDNVLLLNLWTRMDNGKNNNFL